MIKHYCIKNAAGLFSAGIVRQVYDHKTDELIKGVSWSTKRGKQWKTEQTLKNHIMKCMKEKVDMTGWEVLEVHYLPTKPLVDWVDVKMFAKLMAT